MTSTAPTPTIPAAARYELVDGMVLEQTGRHDCGGGTPEVGYAHEPRCGWEVVGPITDLLAGAAVLGAAETFVRTLAAEVLEFDGLTRGRALAILDAVRDEDRDPEYRAALLLEPELDHCSREDVNRVVGGADKALAAARRVLVACGAVRR